MNKSVLVLASASLFLAGCEGSVRASGPFLSELPENVVAIAAPYQDLTAVRINPEDNCYEYRHVGPVETTFLPLRAKNGRPICAAPPPEPAATG